MGLSCGGGPTLPGLGRVDVAALCGDAARCDARGDEAKSTLTGRKARPVFLAATQGPESYLGKVAPERNAASVLKTCGSDIVKSDWVESGPTLRVLELSSEGKKSLREALKTHLAAKLLAQPKLLATQKDASVEALVDAAASGASLQKVGMVSQTYWLTNAAFERRVAQCGEEDYENIIYSLTLLQMSELSHKELESRLYAGLAAKLGPAPALTSGQAEQEPVALDGESEEAVVGSAPAAEPSDTMEGEPSDTMEAAPSDPAAAHEALLRELAFGAVRALANELRIIAAFGYDEP